MMTMDKKDEGYFVEKLYRAKEFYHMAGVTRQTLRHYIDKGLIAPARVAENGYALYGQQELLQLLLLRYYRALELGVDEVKEFLWCNDLPTQVSELDSALETLDAQIAVLREKRKRLEIRRRQVQECITLPEKTYSGEIQEPMYVLHVDEAYRRPDGPELIQALSSRLPHIHISLCGDYRDFNARRPMATRVGYGAVGTRFLEGLNLDAFQCIPVQPCIVARARVENPLLIQPHELHVLYDAVAQGGHEVINGVFGHIISAERQKDGKFYYYIVMRVHVA